MESHGRGLWLKGQGRGLEFMGQGQGSRVVRGLRLEVRVLRVKVRVMFKHNWPSLPSPLLLSEASRMDRTCSGSDRSQGAEVNNCLSGLPSLSPGL